MTSRSLLGRTVQIPQERRKSAYVVKQKYLETSWISHLKPVGGLSNMEQPRVQQQVGEFMDHQVPPTDALRLDSVELHLFPQRPGRQKMI